MLKRLSFCLLLCCALVACERPPQDDCYDAATTTPFIAHPPRPQPPPAETTSVSAVRLELNIPSYTVRAFEEDVLAGSYRVAVGSARYPTRVGSFLITSITWNPWWYPPPSEWARNERKTPPGPRNPMGKVKINYGAAYYLHGTPDSLRLERPLSHGCVRMQNRDVIELALFIQHAIGPPMTEEEKTSLLGAWRPTRTVSLATFVPLEIRYQPVEVVDSVVNVYPDIYGVLNGRIGEAVLQSLIESGVSAGSIDSAAVNRFVGGGRNQATISRSALLH